MLPSGAGERGHLDQWSFLSEISQSVDRIAHPPPPPQLSDQLQYQPLNEHVFFFLSFFNHISPINLQTLKYNFACPVIYRGLEPLPWDLGSYSLTY